MVVEPSGRRATSTRRTTLSPSPARIRSTIASVVDQPDELRQIRLFHKALADVNRLRIVQRLADGSATVTELIDHVGLSQPLVSWHIGKLRASGIVGKTFFGWLSPYAGVAVFGGPVFWTDGAEASTGTDTHHYQVLLGAVASLPQRFDLFVEGSPVGERSLAAGLGVKNAYDINQNVIGTEATTPGLDDVTPFADRRGQTLLGYYTSELQLDTFCPG